MVESSLHYRLPQGTYMIADISIQHASSEQAAKQIDLAAVSLGFDIIFSNFVVTSKQNDVDKAIEALAAFTASRTGTVELNRGRGSTIRERLIVPTGAQPSLIVMSRVTLALAHADKVSVLEETVFRRLANNPKVDCFAIRPANEIQLMELIADPDRFGFDLLSIDLSSGHFFQQMGTVTKSIRSGKGAVSIELELGQLFRNSSGSGTEVTNVVNQCRLVLRRVNGIVVSSGAKSPFDMKSPVDLANWAEGVLGLRGTKRNLGIFIDKILKKKLVRSNFDVAMV